MTDYSSQIADINRQINDINHRLDVSDVQSFNANPLTDPSTVANLQQMINIPYTTTLPTYIPKLNGYRVIYFDGANYNLYIWANGGWRTQVIGGSGSGTNAIGVGSGTTTVSATFTPTKININTSTLANGITYDSANKRYTIVTAGQYLVTGFVFYTSPSTANVSYQTMLYQNGSNIFSSYGIPPTTGVTQALPAIGLVQASASDYFELYAQTGSGSTQSVTGALSYLALAKI